MKKEKKKKKKKVAYVGPLILPWRPRHDKLLPAVLRLVDHDPLQLLVRIWENSDMFFFFFFFYSN
jgi:hypothetical protein